MNGRTLLGIILLVMVGCSPTPNITEQPFYTATPRPTPESMAQAFPLDLGGGNPQALESFGTFQFNVTGDLINEGTEGSIAYNRLAGFGSMPDREQIYIAVSSARNSQQITFEFSPGIAVGTYSLVSPQSFVPGQVSAQYGILDGDSGLLGFSEEVSGALVLETVGATISGHFEFRAQSTENSASGEVSVQSVVVAGSFADVPYNNIDDPFENAVPLPTRIFEGTEAP